ncbi:MAG TPA: discoidin domain-containing protein [Blastocatellia bacterium]|jgi:hypothetical protein
MKPRKKANTRRGVLILIIAIAMIAAAPTPAQQPTVQARAVRPASVEGDLIDITKTLDGAVNTRAYSGKADYAGMSVTLDVGGEQNIIGVIQDHGRWPTNYPGAYRVEVAESASGPWLKTFEGPGTRGVNRTIFEAVRARFIRITATARQGDDWSIAELKAIVDPGARPRRIPQDERPPQRPPTEKPPADAPRTLKDTALAFDKNGETRATSGTADYDGMVFSFDLGGEYEISRIVQIHGRWSEDFPAQYKIEASRERNESRFREVWRGSGEPGRSVARFNPITTRYIRITALRQQDRSHWWSIAELRTNRDPDIIDDEDGRMDRPIRNVTGRGLSDLNAMLDDNERTRATSNRPAYEGSFIVLDMGGSYTISKVMQIHSPHDQDFPRRYRVEVSEDGRNWRGVWEGAGESDRSRAVFPPVRARFVRITALANRNAQTWWSISKLKVSG